MGARIGLFTKPEHLEKLASFMGTSGMSFVLSTQRKECYRNDFDIGVSYCFPYVVKVSDDGRPWYNFHPAPLPRYKGLDCFTDQINDGMMTSSVTLHRMTDELDSGEILRVRDFSLLSPLSHSHELWLLAHYHMFQLFKYTIRDISEGKI